MRKSIFLALGLLVLIFITACTPPQDTQSTSDSQSTTQTPVERGTWRDIVVSDVRSGQQFKISDFEDKPVLLESFAVWCPTCTRQQQEISKLHDEIGDEFVSISLDTDPNEDEAKIIEHLDRNGFDWRYAIAPADLTRSLIDEFGVNVVNAPQAPVILVCGDDSRILQNGLKNANELKSEIAKGC